MMLGIAARTVYSIPEDRLPRYRLGAGAGSVRFDPADVKEYLASCRSVGTPRTSVGASSSIATLAVTDTGLADYFRAAGVKPKLTPTTGRKGPGSTPLRLASSSETR